MTGITSQVRNSLNMLTVMCEISVSVHISTNLEGQDAKWPFKIKTPDTYTDKKKTTVLVPGEERSLSLEPGDGLLYKGCERPHWRDPMLVEQRKCLVRRWNTTITKSSSIMFLLMDNVLPLCMG